jgi:phage gp36-like protein
MADLTQYATRAQLAEYGLPSATLDQIDSDVQDDHLIAATSVARSYLRQRHSTEITAVGDEVAQAVCKIAAVSLLTHVIGIDPNTVSHALLITERDNAILWLRDVAAGKAVADVTDSTADDSEGWAIYTEDSRGWGDDLI